MVAPHLTAWIKDSRRQAGGRVKSFTFGRLMAVAALAGESEVLWMRDASLAAGENVLGGIRRRLIAAGVRQYSQRKFARSATNWRVLASARSGTTVPC
jgi:hypothetical protein